MFVVAQWGFAFSEPKSKQAGLACLPVLALRITVWYARRHTVKVHEF